MTITPDKKDPRKVESTSLATPDGGTPRGRFSPYREDQGRHMRMGAFWVVVFFLGFGCRFLHDILIRWESMREPLGGITIPVAGVKLSPAFMLSFGIFAVGVLFIRGWQQRPKVADLLIETEAELKKVSWPKPHEVWNASMIVVISVLILGGFLAFADVFLYRLMQYLILGGG